MLRDNNKLYLFDFLEYYESIKNESHRFHFDDAALQTFLQGNKIFVGSFSKTSETAYKKSKCHRFIKINRCPTNAAHAILRHIRNSIAHGRISYSRKNILKLEERKTNKQERENLCVMLKNLTSSFSHFQSIILMLKLHSIQTNFQLFNLMILIKQKEISLK